MEIKKRREIPRAYTSAGKIKTISSNTEDQLTQG